MVAYALEKSECFVSLKLFVKKLKDRLQISRTMDDDHLRRVVESSETNEAVPDDVREGHFAILLAAAGDEKPIRFVVELCVLKHPAFIKLLKMAEEEYGFRQRGPLTIPCQPEDVWRIIRDKSWKSL